MTILFVEDEGMLRRGVATMLRERGLTVIEADDGNAAVERFRADRPNINLVLLDMTIPGKSGPMVLEDLHRMDPDLKVIVTSAYGREHVQKLLHGLPILDYIQKPYGFAEIETVLRSVRLDSRPGPAGVSA
jgi:DNA-binding response OmpR family regulator